MSDIDQSQIQGLVFTGYPELPFATFLVLTVKDRPAAGAWLEHLLAGDRVTDGRKPDRKDARTQAVNLAFSHAGLAAWGLAPDALARFPQEFAEGMAGSTARSRVLGDIGSSRPETWRWGARGQAEGAAGVRPPHDVHVLLLLYAQTDDGLRALVSEQRAALEGGFAVRYERTTNTLRDPDDRLKEHFGFTDGLSQPRIEGSATRRTPEEALTFIKAGEFILGFANEYDQRPVAPTVPSGEIANRFLPEAPDGTGPSARRDLGANGSYLVARQLEQDVEGFWTAMWNASGEEGAPPSRGEAERLAAKCVGRWLDGTPLARSPDGPRQGLADENAFGYDDDKTGLKCPVGAHVRRANPRDSLEPGPQESARLVRRHTIMRRGRSYGPPRARWGHLDSGEGGEGGEGGTATEPRQERGLFFIAINSNISRQFEFIQQTWLNNPKFDGLDDEADPISGAGPARQRGDFTIGEDPVRRRLRGLPSFVTVRGGEYFFLPGLAALGYLSKLGKLP